jgi:hypothetical protein
MMPIVRFHDWQLRLEAFARERQAMPFAWGRNDCALFAADAVLCMTGVRLLPNMRGYSTARDALRLIDGAGGLRGIACHALGGFILPVYARIGDVVLHRTGKREALGICNGGTLIAPGRQGMVAVPLSNAVAAWRVG